MANIYDKMILEEEIKEFAEELDLIDACKIFILYCAEDPTLLHDKRMRENYKFAKEVTKGHWAPSKTIVECKDGTYMEFNLEGRCDDKTGLRPRRIQ